MAVFLRLDDRLIHGQIVTAWSRHLQVKTLMVANDKVAKDELTKAALMMTAPAGMKVTIRSIEETIKLLSDPRAEKMRILLLVDNPKDAVVLVKNLGIQEVNVGNFTKKKVPDKIQISENCHATKEDIEDFKELCQICGNVYIQMIPDLAKTDFRTQLEKVL